MRIVILGAGAVGGYFGGRLAQAGHDVVFIARGEHLKAMQSRGLRVDSIDGDFVLPSIEATDNPSGVRGVDVVLVCVKTWQLFETAHTMAPLIDEKTFVVPLLNGVESHLKLAEILGFKHVLAGLAKIVCVIAEPGHIRHTGMKPYIAFGELDNKRSDREKRLLQAFKDAGIKADVPPDINAALWEKFLFVVSWGGVGAITRSPIGVLRRLPETRKMLEQAMGEIFAVARAHCVPLPNDVVTKTMSFVDALPAGGTTSLQRDIEEGRRSELDAWNGAVLRLGRDSKVPVPLHTFIYNSLLPLELAAMKKFDPR